MSQSLADSVNHYKECVKNEAQEILKVDLPKTILELNSIIENLPSTPGKDLFCEFDNLKIESANEAPADLIPCNKQVCNLIQIVKPYIARLQNQCKVLKMWLTYSIPKIEDGNNFGVEVQELIRDKIISTELAGDDYSFYISEYFVVRGKRVSKVIKYPQVSDYRRAVRELDERNYLQLLHMTVELRNCFGNVYDIITKNLDKINVPRVTNNFTMY